ncbi:MAG: CRISPR-associated endonuclease Cas2 [Paludibacteraceae bacterium]|nr:CRISPR-associated endonuclease Cas2 [Paludibacteraceae bacterium]
MSLERLNKYRVMWAIVFFDLPVTEKSDARAAQHFRKFLMQEGFTMMQFSVYMRCCPSMENANVHLNRVRQFLPVHGNVVLFTITDKQFGQMQFYSNLEKKKEKSEEDNSHSYEQLTIF